MAQVQPDPIAIPSSKELKQQIVVTISNMPQDKLKILHRLVHLITLSNSPETFAVLEELIEELEDSYA
jgi:hypothetical protein